MRGHLSARSRLTLLYASLFALGGAALVWITYLLVARTLDSTATTRISPSIQPAIGKCVVAAQTGGGLGALNQCARLYASGVQAQRGTTLTHLLTYSLLSLAGAGGAAVSAEELLEHVWDAHADPFSNTVAVTVGRLRRKLGDPPLIETVVGKGYRM